MNAPCMKNNQDYLHNQKISYFVLFHGNVFRRMSPRTIVRSLLVLSYFITRYLYGDEFLVCCQYLRLESSPVLHTRYSDQRNFLCSSRNLWNLHGVVTGNIFGWWW